MNLLIAFDMYFGRMGSLDGLFVCTSEELENIIGKEIYFGEVLGKHSEIYGTVTEKNFKVVSDCQDKIDWLVKVIGGKNISGYNPVEIWKEQQEETDDEWEAIPETDEEV